MASAAERTIKENGYLEDVTVVAKRSDELVIGQSTPVDLQQEIHQINLDTLDLVLFSPKRTSPDLRRSCGFQTLRTCVLVVAQKQSFTENCPDNATGFFP